MKQAVIEHRNRLSREKRWMQMDEKMLIMFRRSLTETSSILMYPIRTRDSYFQRKIYLRRYIHRRKEVPKTLIFAKTDSHADDIVQMVRTNSEKEMIFRRKLHIRRKSRICT
ncbi:MAG: hypothetical protein ACLTW9_29610 [Enterocloster sp.]